MGRNNWQIKSLGEVATVKTGYPFDSDLFNEEEGFPVIRIRDIKRGATSTYYKGEIIEDYLVKNGDYLIGMDGEFNLAEWKSDDALLNQRACKIVFNDQMIDPRFGFYFLPKKLKEIEDSTSFVTVKHISHKQILKIQIQLPPLPIQKQIAEILEQVDKAKQKRKEASKLTDEFLQSVFIEMFGDPIHNQKGYPIKELKTLTVENINYGVVQPGEVVNDGVPLIRVGDFEGLRISKLNLKKISFEIESAYVRSRIIGDEVLIACVGSIGKVALVDISLIGYNTVRAVARVRVNENLERLYLAHYLSLPFIQEYFIRQTRTVSQPTLNIKQIAETPVILPPLRLQQQFAEIVNKTEALKEKQKQSEQELENLFQSLMQKAFKGELYA